MISGSVVVALLAIDGAHEDDGPAPAARRILCYINLLTLVLFIEPLHFVFIKTKSFFVFTGLLSSTKSS